MTNLLRIRRLASLLARPQQTAPDVRSPRTKCRRRPASGARRRHRADDQPLPGPVWRPREPSLTALRHRRGGCGVRGCSSTILRLCVCQPAAGAFPLALAESPDRDSLQAGDPCIELLPAPDLNHTRSGRHRLKSSCLSLTTRRPRPEDRPTRRRHYDDIWSCDEDRLRDQAGVHLRSSSRSTQRHRHAHLQTPSAWACVSIVARLRNDLFLAEWPPQLRSANQHAACAKWARPTSDAPDGVQRISAANNGGLTSPAR